MENFQDADFASMDSSDLFDDALIGRLFGHHNLGSEQLENAPTIDPALLGLASPGQATYEQAQSDAADASVSTTLAWAPEETMPAAEEQQMLPQHPPTAPLAPPEEYDLFPWGHYDPMLPAQQQHQNHFGGPDGMLCQQEQQQTAMSYGSVPYGQTATPFQEAAPHTFSACSPPPARPSSSKSSARRSKIGCARAPKEGNGRSRAQNAGMAQGWAQAHKFHVNRCQHEEGVHAPECKIREHPKYEAWSRQSEPRVHRVTGEKTRVFKEWAHLHPKTTDNQRKPNWMRKQERNGSADHSSEN